MIKILSKFFLFLLVCLLMSNFTAHGDELNIIESTDSYFHFTQSINISELKYQVEPDSLKAYFYNVHIGIPSGASVRLVSASGKELSSLSSDKINPDMISSVPHPLVEISNPKNIRGRQFVTIRIYPIVGAQFFSEVEVKISFNSGQTTSGNLPNDPNFDRILKALLSNYDQFSTWKIPAKPISKLASTSSPFADGGDWYKIEVATTGLIKITGEQLQNVGISLNNLNSDDIHIYNGGGKQLPFDNSANRPTFDELAIYIDDGGDELFDNSNFLLFYGEAVDRWIYEPEATYYINNIYTDRNIYWLHLNSTPGLRMSSIDANPTQGYDTVISDFQRNVHLEQDNMLLMQKNGRTLDFYTWYWSNEDYLELFVSTPGVIAGEAARVYLDGRTSSPYMQLYVNNIMAEDTCNKFNCRYGVSWLQDGLNNFKIYLSEGYDALPYFNYLEVFYTSRLLPVSNILDLHLEPFEGNGLVRVINNFNSPPLILDISNPLKPNVVTNSVTNTQEITFITSGQNTDNRRFYLGRTANAVSPVSIKLEVTNDLVSNPQQTDLIVITDRRLENALDEYVAYRESEGFSISVITVEDIYNNFSFGLFDPTAIRDFLKFAYENIPAPSPAGGLLVGDGNYDYLDVLKSGVDNRIPPYVNSYDRSVSDDNYIYFGDFGILDSDTSYQVDNIGYDMYLARWPVRSSAEINIIVNKIKQYESASNTGFWKNKITLVADDEYGEFDGETFHTTQTEELEIYHIPRHFYRNKIYLWDYPFVNQYKPAVNDDIVKAINEGTLIINYAGHGSPDLWAHEHVFTRYDDVPRLKNYDKLSLFFAASCAIGFFDAPERDALAEDLLVHPNGGAIGVVSATRLVWSGDNAQFNQETFDILLKEDSLTIAEAVYLAKLKRQYNLPGIPSPEANDRAYLLFGDPLVKLIMPKLGMELVEFPDSLKALERTNIRGNVLDETGNTYIADGRLVINIYDAQRQKTYKNIDYKLTGSAIYRGTASITNGAFDFDFIAPLDVSYGGEGAQIYLYAEFENTDAIGLVDSLGISNTAFSTTDSIGPEIIFSFTGIDNFQSGDYVPGDANLEVIITDSSGVNLSGSLGHGITLVIDGEAENLINLTNKFEYDPDNYNQGTLDYQINDLQPGNHAFKLKVWDNANNFSTVEFAAQVSAENGLAIMDMLNYPNPMNENTRFSYYLTQRVEKFSLNIYTLSGRKIRTFERYPTESGYFDDIEWYGDDFHGDRVATGVYLYKAMANPISGEDAVEVYGKVVVIN